MELHMIIGKAKLQKNTFPNVKIWGAVLPQQNDHRNYLVILHAFSNTCNISVLK